MSILSEFTTSFVTQPDGTPIGYRQIGAGPGLILVHGGMQSSLNFTHLAKALSTAFTVYVPDRRGRGLSGAYGDKNNIVTEANDILALVRHTGAQNIFGLSSGAIVTLQAAILEPVFKKIALYEPPILEDEGVFKKLDADYEGSMRTGNLGRAFLAIMKGTGDPGDTSFLNILPAFITAPLMNMMMKTQKKGVAEDELPLAALIPTFHHDRIIIRGSWALVAKASNIRAGVLLMNGSKSQKYFRPVLEKLASCIPGARRIEFEKLGHVAADNIGDPLKVAGELMTFFKEN